MTKQNMSIVASIGEKNQDPMSFSVEQLLESVLNDVRADDPDFRPAKAIIVLLDNRDSHYHRMIAMCGMTRSEVIALLQVTLQDETNEILQTKHS